MELHSKSLLQPAYNCTLQHLGLWLVDEIWFANAVEAVKSGNIKPDQHRIMRTMPWAPRMAEHDIEDDMNGEIISGPNGMVIVPIRGHLVKGRSSFGGVSTVDMRRRIRELARDDSVTGIMLFVESPGGTAAGTFELATEIEKAASMKPLRAHIEDEGASAAFWIITHALRITANTMAQVGSIGTVGLLIDSSKRMELSGLKVHVLSTGKFKGAGAPGSKITEEQIAVFQEEIDDINAHFLAGISRGRSFSPTQLAAVATGRTWIADKALTLGLIDAVRSWEEAVSEFASSLEQRQPGQMIKSMKDSRRRSLGLAEMEIELKGDK